jgi:hypothetical protein
MCAPFLPIILKTAAIKEQTFELFWSCDFPFQNAPINMALKQCFQSLK